MQESAESQTHLSGSFNSDFKAVPTSRLLFDARLWLLVAAFVVVGVFSLNDTMLYTPDCPRYLIWARSLAAFEGFKDTSNPDPSLYVVHAPFYPLLLAPLAWFFGNIIIPAKVVTILFGAALIVLFYVWAAKRSGKTWALVGAFFLALNPLILLFSTHVLSDIPFTVFIILFFMLAEKMSDAPEEERWGWMFVVVLTLGIFLREVGLTLLLGALSYLLLRKEYRRLLLVFTIPMLFYMIWYFRNEVYIAGIENPPMRNMKIFLSHAFTGGGASLVDEFLARLRINIAVYLNQAKGLILFPQYLGRLFPVVTPSNPMMSGMMTVLGYAQYPLVLLQYGLFAWGVVVTFRTMKTMLLVILFSFFYLMMVLLYPINDLRFLVPILVLVLYFAAAGGQDVAARLARLRSNRRVVFASAAFLGILLAIPNGVWTYNYVANNRVYVGNLNETSKPFLVGARTPELYVRPISLIGEWIGRQRDSSTTVLARWKELTFWINGRKMLDTDPLLSLTLFEGLLRDYNVGYIVSLITDPGIREFEFQMLQSKKFGFTPVYRAGNLEVIQVHHLYRHMPDAVNADLRKLVKPLAWVSDREQEARGLFREGIELLESDRHQEAVNMFHALLEMTRGSGYMALFKGIALEFGGQYDEAMALYDRFRYQPQAGPFVRHAWFHQMLITESRKAEVDTGKTSKAMTYHKISAGYWDLGFHKHAFDVLQLGLQADSAFAPGLIFGMYYSLELGDTTGARTFSSRTQLADSNHIMNKPVRRIFALMDSTRMAKTVEKRIGYELSLATIYYNIGLRELSIDQSLAILQRDPKNAGALELLAQCYDAKERNWPAIQILERLLAVKPDSPVARQKLAELKSHLN
ncbi:MAG: glycosyltransferase family 39 protein [Ignavibacteriales bacterium]|nr:glycosyltransferase family 39 protein [Ignavibacteriales bacterium]